MTMDILAPTLSDHDLEDLAKAVRLLEGQSLANRLTRALGGGIERWGRALPSSLRNTAARAAEGALRVALRVALRTLSEKAPGDADALNASTRWHRLAATASGAIGGAFGNAGLGNTIGGIAGQLGGGVVRVEQTGRVPLERYRSVFRAELLLRLQ